MTDQSKSKISYHLDKTFIEKKYAHNWRSAEVATARDVARIMVSYAWSGVVWDGGRRLRSSPGFSDWFGLDFESYDRTVEWAKQTFCDMIHVIGTTRNHNLSKDGAPPIERFRVALKWSDRIKSREDYEYNLQKLIAHHGADKACKNWSRLFWPCTKIVCGSDSGYTQDWVKSPPRPPRVITPFKPHEAMPPYLRNRLIYGVQKGKRHNEIYKVFHELGLRNFSQEVALEALHNSPLKDAEDDYERTATDAWRAGREEAKNQ